MYLQNCNYSRHTQSAPYATSDYAEVDTTSSLLTFSYSIVRHVPKILLESYQINCE